MAFSNEVEPKYIDYPKWLLSIKDRKIDDQNNFTVLARSSSHGLPGVLFAAEVYRDTSGAYFSKVISDAVSMKDLMGVDFIFRSTSMPEIQDLGFALDPIAWSNESVEDIANYAASKNSC